MGFSFVWFKKRGRSLVKGEFLRFLQNRIGYNRTFKLRRRFKRPKRLFFIKTKTFPFFCFNKLSCFRRIRGGFNIKYFFDLFFWVRFLITNTTFKSNLSRPQRSLSCYGLNLNLHSFFFQPLTRGSLVLPKSFKGLKRYRRVSKLFLRNRKVRVRFFLFNSAVLYFFYFLFIKQSFRLLNFHFFNGYLNFLFNLSNNYL